MACCGRIAFVGILLYVTLDLSVAVIPGAFVFEPAESVESTQTSRWRAAGENVPSPTTVSNTLVSPPPADHQHARRRVVAVRRPVMIDATGRLPRSALAAPPSSEEPL